MRNRIRVGAVNYLNTKPLIEGLTDFAPEIALSLELPTATLESLIRTLPEIQQVALPRERGNKALRVIRRPEAWSLERDLADESLLLVLATGDGYEWCFHLDDAEVFKMANSLRDERAVTLPEPAIRQ